MRAVIPAGGFGTRMLPATKSMPKEMLPVLDKPAIQYVVEEALDAGIEDIAIITGRHKKAVEDHFDAAPELEAFLEGKHKLDALATVRGTAGGARMFYVRQDAPRGLGHAVLQAAPFVEHAPFAVLLGDDIIRGARPVVSQLIDAHKKTGASVFAVQKVPPSETSKYGIVETEPLGDGLHRVVDMVEKPDPANAPGDLAAIGRYVFTPEILGHLRTTPPGVGGEIQLTDAMKKLIDGGGLYCLEFEGHRHDLGSLKGWLQANLALAAEAGIPIDAATMVAAQH